MYFQGFSASYNWKITVELHLSGLTGMASPPDMHKIQIIGFFFENRLHWLFEVEKTFLQRAVFWLHIYLHTNKTIVRNS